jgi:hypothetical protein
LVTKLSGKEVGDLYPNVPEHVQDAISLLLSGYVGGGVPAQRVSMVFSADGLDVPMNGIIYASSSEIPALVMSLLSVLGLDSSGDSILQFFRSIAFWMAHESHSDTYMETIRYMYEVAKEFVEVDSGTKH